MLVASPASAATLRVMGTLSGPVVHVCDLWDGAGAAGRLVLGPGPAPGESITVGATQLAAIARAYGVDWVPRSSGDTAVLTRRGAPLALPLVLGALRPVLAAQGAGGGAGFEIDLPFYSPPLLDPVAAPRLAVEQLALDPVSGRFNAVIAVLTGDAGATRLRVEGSVAVTVEGVVAAHRLNMGDILGPEDVTAARVRARPDGGSVALTPAALVGRQMRRGVAAGQALAAGDVQAPVVVARNDRVLLALAMPGLEVGAMGEALAAGGVGDRITVRNPVSGAVLSARITGPDRAMVDPDTPPVMPGRMTP